MSPPRACDANQGQRPVAEAKSVVLAQRAAAGDLPAAHALLAQLTPTVARVVAGVMGRAHADFDDIVQQSLIAVLGALPAFRCECHPAGFASSIAFRVALKSRKREHLERSRRERLALLSLAARVDVAPLDLSNPARRRQLLRDLLERLPEEQAEALGLRVILGWSLDQVAGATGVPVNTVRSRVRLAKEALRRRLESRPDLREELEVGR
jgi:RNA polymerase sigma-70 factor (ECF subfamily)